MPSVTPFIPSSGRDSGDKSDVFWSRMGSLVAWEAVAVMGSWPGKCCSVAADIFLLDGLLDVKGGELDEKGRKGSGCGFDCLSTTAKGFA